MGSGSGKTLVWKAFIIFIWPSECRCVLSQSHTREIGITREGEQAQRRIWYSQASEKSDQTAGFVPWRSWLYKNLSPICHLNPLFPHCPPKAIMRRPFLFQRLFWDISCKAKGHFHCHWILCGCDTCGKTCIIYLHSQNTMFLYILPDSLKVCSIPLILVWFCFWIQFLHWIYTLLKYCIMQKGI